MPTREHGYIKALNVNTGATWEIRPDMLRIQNHHWRVLDEKYLHLPGAMRNQEGALATEAIDTKADIQKPKDKGEVRVIMTSKNKPFATENAARSAMARKKLSENEWIVLPDRSNGFIISKV